MQVGGVCEGENMLSKMHACTGLNRLVSASGRRVDDGEGA